MTLLLNNGKKCAKMPIRFMSTKFFAKLLKKINIINSNSQTKKFIGRNKCFNGKIILHSLFNFDKKNILVPHLLLNV